MLSEETLRIRRGNLNASVAHAIMTGWSVPRPAGEYPAELYDWIAKNGVNPSLKLLKGKVSCEVTTDTVKAAWAMHQFNKVPQGLITHAETMACEQLFDNDPSLEFTSRHMENGNEREEEAMERLREATGIDFVHTGEEQLHIHQDGIGATPDGLSYDELDLIAVGAEVKCRSPLHHMRQLCIVDNATLLEHDFDRYCQIQVGYLVTGAEKWYSVNYNPFARFDAHRFNYCVIEKDDHFLRIFKERAALTFKYKQDFLDKYLPKQTSITTEKDNANIE